MTGNRPRTFNPVFTYQFQADKRIIPICGPERIPLLHRFTRTSAYGSISGRNGVNPCGNTTSRRGRLASSVEHFRALNTDATTAMAADESFHLGKAANVVDLAAMGTGGLAGFHFHYGALDIGQGHDGSAFVTDEFSLFPDNLVEAAAAICAEEVVG
jgi:hypothetical protein